MSTLQSPKKAALPRAERDARIIQLRASGVPLERIAASVNSSERTVSRVIRRRLDELHQQIQLDTAGLRAGHLLELQGLRARLSPLLVAPEPADRVQAVRSWIALLAREAALLGLDAPASIALAARAEASAALLDHLADHLHPDLLKQVLDALSVASSTPGPERGRGHLSEA